MSRAKRYVRVASSFLCSWVITAVAHAAPVYVDSDGTCLPVDGSSWCNAFADLQDALAAATAGTEVRVAEGTYRPDRGTGDRLATFLLKHGVVVTGGYAGYGAADPDARDVAAYETILSGDLSSNDGPDFTNYGDNSYHIVTYNDLNASGVVLDGFTVSHSNADGTGPDGTITNQGGAIHIRDNSRKCIPGGPTIRKCTIRDNWVAQHGAVNDHALASTFENCTFVDNFAGAEGGGLLVHSGNATVTNCQFISNQVGSVVGEGAGGGVWLGRDTDATCELYPTPVFTDCVFRENDSRNDGGGLYSLAGNHPSLVRCVFENNTADDDGGAVFDLFNSLGDYVDCSFSGNRAEHYGGALYVYGGDNTLDNCTFTANTAMFKGGGIYGGGHMQGCAFTSNSGLEGGGFYGATDTVVENCTFTQNHASATQHAGAGFFGGPFAGAEVRGCTFRQNTTPGFGGGLLKYYQSHPMTVQGCTFIENTALGGAGMYATGLYSDDPTISVIDCSFFGNGAEFGGGLYLCQGVQTIVNCAFGGNSAHGNGATGRGGAVLSAYDETSLINCTLYGNTADEGGGIYSQSFDDPANSGSVLIANSILWGNSDSSGRGLAAQIFNDFESAPVVKYSCVEGWDGSLSGVGVIDQNPLFVDPDGIDNIPGTVDDNLRLTGASPAIDSGDNSILSPDITTDFDGGPRVINGIVDMGAYEQDLCTGQAEAIPPELELIGDEVSVKNRFISIRLPDSSQSVAVRVLFLDLPTPFDAWNDEELWVGPTHQVSENGASLIPIDDFQSFLAAPLQCSPYYTDWPDAEFVHIYHEGIVPGGTYRIQLIDISCAASEEGNFSPALDASASRWGDTIRDFTTIPPGPPDGAVNITDVSAIVGRFGSAPDAIAKVRADLEPGCLDLVINVSDILSSVTGFQGLDYPFEPTADSPCDSTCLSLVP